VLGKVAHALTGSAAALGTNVGNGTFGAIAVGDPAVAGVYTVRIDATHYVVEDPAATRSATASPPSPSRRRPQLHLDGRRHAHGRGRQLHDHRRGRARASTSPTTRPATTGASSPAPSSTAAATPPPPTRRRGQHPRPDARQRRPSWCGAPTSPPTSTSRTPWPRCRPRRAAASRRPDPAPAPAARPFPDNMPGALKLRPARSFSHGLHGRLPPGRVLDVELTSTVERIPYQPTLLGDMNIFTPNPIRTKALAVEERDGVLTLIPTSQRGQPINSERTTEKRKMRYFEVPRLCRATPSRPTRCRHPRLRRGDRADAGADRGGAPPGRPDRPGGQHRLHLGEHAPGAVQGLLLDADGSTLYNWYDEFGFVAPAEVHFNLAAGAANTLRPLINGIVRTCTARPRAPCPRAAGSSPSAATLLRPVHQPSGRDPDLPELVGRGATSARRPGRGLLGLPVRRGSSGSTTAGSDDNATIKIPTTR
jgi:hypothetical protein